MKIIDLDYTEYKMHNPVTGEIIVDMECNEVARSMKAYWVDMAFNEPHFNDAELQAAWESFTSDYEKNNYGVRPDYEALEVFLQDHDNPQWIVFRIESSGMSNGTVSSTAWYVVEKEVIVEEVDLKVIDWDEEADDDD
jgi:hypothetical protein